MSAIGTKRQLAPCKAMSGVGDKADLMVEGAPTSQFDPQETCSEPLFRSPRRRGQPRITPAVRLFGGHRRISS